MRKITAIVTAMLVVAGGTTWAGDCIIASRSDKGETAAGSSSSVWVSVSVDAFAHSPGFPPGYDPDCFVEHWLAGGGPASFTTRSDKVIGAGTSNPNLGDHKGLDHIEEAFGALFGASLAACAL